ncbi:Crp/Fnr family transcriptional regulator [Desulforamulus hydrothermalis]|uniref:Transcriptional regulator, Crp/Fnr family n=1 Tax=Desulforamulus hydrothermalis Lam5 = DSM 18033 TaxID=1121428 RepID=K8DZZ2_9FIRM|nr:Crp/Fnr family transcriptional regulator [Desulforamulus hydrothermalis]CCO08752.1 Transcriptional regulator, Crp/Fnr family [Desulforamulus hydrothermalis Lam5 = DSM 18033]SHG70635.1 transcriptional regulator, Crp/Fnr family [Desulforamulus hydrothermalis Lam5 = DSM 18033]
MENIKYLLRIPLFYGLPDNQLLEISRLLLERSYQKGRIIFMEGEPGEALYILKSGLIKLTRRSEDGREHILHFVNPGEVFAEVVLFDGGDYPATAEVQEDCVVGILRNQDIERLISQNPGMAVAMLRIMSRRLRAAQEKVMHLALHDTARRLAFTLIKMAEDHGITKPGGIYINFNLTNQELANLTGSTRETVNRMLSSFKRSGAIEVDRQRIVIVDKKKLEDLLR